MGRAPPLVLLHGLGTGPEGWGPQLAAFGGARGVLTPALRLDGDFSVEEEAGRLLGELPDEPVDLCGLSLGSLVALRMALDRRTRVRRLAVCAGFSSLPLRYRALQAVVGAAAALVRPGELGHLDRRGIRAVFRAGRRFDISGEVQGLTMPVLVLVGERDRVNRALSSRLAASIGTAELAVVPGAGHVANVDAPEAFNTALRGFLS
jgi:pimeloyl-ACP methyl ester carboxylesterase